MADRFAAARMRAALFTGVRVTLVVGTVLAGFAATATLVVGNLSARILAGKLGDPDPLVWGGTVAAVVLAVGLPLSVLLAVKARRAPSARLKIGGELAEVKRWVPPAPAEDPAEVAP